MRIEFVQRVEERLRPDEIAGPHAPTHKWVENVVSTSNAAGDPPSIGDFLVLGKVAGLWKAQRVHRHYSETDMSCRVLVVPVKDEIIG